MTTPHTDRYKSPIDIGDTVIMSVSATCSGVTSAIVTGFTPKKIKIGKWKKKSPANVVVWKKADKKDIEL